MAELRTGGEVTTRKVWPIEGCLYPLRQGSGIDLVVHVSACGSGAELVDRIRRAIDRDKPADNPGPDSG